MTAEEIRKEASSIPLAVNDNPREAATWTFWAYLGVGFLAEIAAQLAEMNERARK